MRAQEPDADEKGYFNTSLPVILFQMIEQNVSGCSMLYLYLVANNTVIKQLAQLPIVTREKSHCKRL